MNNLFSEFKSVDKESWRNKLISDLKGKEPDILLRRNTIEEIEYSSVVHHSESTPIEDPGSFPFTRGSNKPNNNWWNGRCIQVDNEELANKEAINSLMTGTDLLIFNCRKVNADWTIVLEDIKLDHVKIQFDRCSYDDFLRIQKETKEHINVQYNFDLSAGALSELELGQIIASQRTKQSRVFTANGYGIQQAGANTWQEISYCLSAGHEILVKLLELGMTIDQAAACISFKLGVGSDYILETAKFRALKSLWSALIAVYEPKHNCTHNCSITAVIGLSNKSLKDPYTNLLRQTTECMSAINASIESILVLPYDTNSTNGPSDLAKRMASNLSLILKEEVYLDKVIDPLGGSYSIEKLTQILKEKAWKRFLEMEKSGGINISETWSVLKREIEQVRMKRIELLKNKDHVLIGVNAYQGENSGLEFDKAKVDSYREMPFLVLENELEINE